MHVVFYRAFAYFSVAFGRSFIVHCAQCLVYCPHCVFRNGYTKLPNSQMLTLCTRFRGNRWRDGSIDHYVYRLTLFRFYILLNNLFYPAAVVVHVVSEPESLAGLIRLLRESVHRTANRIPPFPTPLCEIRVIFVLWTVKNLKKKKNPRKYFLTTNYNRLKTHFSHILPGFRETIRIFIVSANIL